MDIYILNKNGRNVEEKLKSDLPGFNIRVFTNVEVFYDYVVKTAVIADTFIVTDSGMDCPNTELSTSFSLLKQLINYDYFEPKSIIFLNKSQNSFHKSKYEFLARQLTEAGKTATVVTRDSIDFKDLEGMITQTSASFKPPVLNKKAVVQVVRGSKAVSTKVLPTFSTEETVAISLAPADTITPLVKEQHENNETPLEIEDESGNVIEEFPEEMDISFEEDKGDLKYVKYITVTGCGGSGVSTTSLMMALNGCLEDRTLLIDADMHLGLSNLVENFLPADRYYEINLEDILKRKDKAIEEIVNTTSTANLHVMQVTLPTVRAVGENTIEFVILNLLSLLQENYKYIVIDLPTRMLNNYPTLLSKSDVVLACFSPYLNKAVQLLQTVQQSKIIKSSKPYQEGMFIGFMTGIPDLNGLPTMTIREYKVYCQSILGKEIPCTNPFICTDRQFVSEDRFRAIIDKANAIFNKKEGE